MYKRHRYYRIGNQYYRMPDHERNKIPGKSRQQKKILKSLCSNTTIARVAIIMFSAYCLWFLFCVNQLNKALNTSERPPFMPILDKVSLPIEPVAKHKEKMDDQQSKPLEDVGNVKSHTNIGKMDKTHLSIETEQDKTIFMTAYLEDSIDAWSEILNDKTPMTPRNTAKSHELVEIKYGDAESCIDIPSRLPVDSKRYKNIQNGRPLPQNRNLLIDQAKEGCPTDGDPWLPWIHDVFPSIDGAKVSFIAQNRRMCNTAKVFINEAQRLEAQIALLQPVSVKRVKIVDDNNVEMMRYQLTNRQEADDDGKETKFICVFHNKDGTLYYETLSSYPFNYEMVSHRKGEKAMFTRDGLDKGQFWLSTMQFDCPVPIDLQQKIKNGVHVENMTTSLFVDLVPIRTPVRMKQWYLTNDQVGKMDQDLVFDPIKAYGDSSIIPQIKDSGRLVNFPICKSPLSDVNTSSKHEKDEKDKKDKIIACIWASATYTTRGSTNVVGDGEQRLKEWIAFHKLVGIDHFYVYDNTMAHSEGIGKDRTLKPIVEMFPEATWINWPSQICNNQKPKSWNPGERSSQYAAEASCRARYGPGTTWLASMDSDEYLIPSGNHKNLKQVLDNAEIGGANILSFMSARAYPRLELMQ